jgi:ferredoxin--NADP+ reductase
MTSDTTAAPSPHHPETVTWVHHWTDRLFSFKITRPASFRFRSGEFVMIGLPGKTKPIMRAYSIASPCFAEELEFLSIKVPGGPLTSRLQLIEVGDTILLGKKPTGTLVLDAVKAGRRLFLIGTGTGLAPFLSIPRDPEAYERFEQMVVTHTVRDIEELAYRNLWESEIFDDELVGDQARKQLTYYPTVTRAPFHRPGRITARIESGAFFQDLGMPAHGFDPELDRVMLCGSMAMNKDVAAILEGYGLREGSNNEPREYVLERAFVG